MGVAIPLGYVEDRSSGALVVDGGLRFDSSKSHNLINNNTRSASSADYTVSVWVKRVSLNSSGLNAILQYETGDTFAFSLTFYADKVYAYDSSGFDADAAYSDGLLRDTSGWYHLHYKRTSGGTGTLYINGIQQSKQTSGTLNLDAFAYNGSIGYRQKDSTRYLDAYLSNLYVIDGQALNPSSFGFTDPLTNTWRPKKYTGTYGTKGFFLPFDGSAPIGQDQSGRGNNWTPVNFGGSNTLEKATGALPILNTDGGGKVARVGVRTDSSASSLVLALPLVGIKSDFSNAVNSGTSNKATTVTTSSFSSADSIFYGGSLSMASGYVTVTDSSDFNFGTGSYTVECWVNVTSGGAAGSGFISKWYAGSQGTTNSWLLYRGTNGSLYFVISADGINGTDYTTAASTVQTNKWVHCAACYDASTTTLRLFVDGVVQKTQSSPNTPATVSRNVTIGRWDIGDGTWSGYIQDVRIYKGLAKYTQNFIPASTDPDILPDTPSGVSYTSNLTQITDGAVAFDGSGDYLSLADSADLDLGNSNFTIEGFVYVNSTSGSQQTFVAKGTGANNQASYHIALNTSGNWVYYLSSNGSTWDIVSAAVIGTYTPNAWQHITLVRSGNTFTPYLNGVAGTPTTSSATLFDSNKILSIGADDPGNQLLFGFISNAHIVKGTALYTSNFTPPTGPISSVANTKLLCCKSQTSATAADVTPGTITANGNAAATNFNPFTVNINTQRGKQSGWCTLNPLDVYGSATFSNGNLTINPAIGSGNAAFGSLPVTSGKWYWEVTVNTDSALGSMIGITDYQYPVSRRSWYSTSGAQGWFYYADGSKYTPGNPYSASSYGSSYTTADVISIALNMDAGTCVMYKNGISQGTLTSTGLSGNLIGPALGQGQGGTSGQPVYSANFGQKPFKFPPPAGFQPLALANTPRPTIVRPDQYVGVTTYTGNGGTQSIGGLGFKPDLVWIKCRDASVYHALFDSVRGVNKRLGSNETSAEQDQSPSGLSQFLSNGFTVVDGATGGNGINGSPGGLYAGTNASYVAWAWKAGGNSNTYNINDVGYATASAAGLTAGTITPTGASVNTKSGFSIITYNGNLTTTGNSTVGHGLGRTPAFWISKSRSSTGDDSGAWVIWHKNLSSNTFLRFSTATPQSSDGTLTQPTSSVFTTTWNSGFNVSGNTYVAYCWAEIPGFSKFGSYTGNGSADGPMLVTGFRPRWILIRRTDAVEDWNIFDTARSTYNVMGHDLIPNRSDAEYTGTYIDSLSNGFKVRETNSSRNASGGTYIYAAFAETPTQNLYGAQANAR